MNIQTDTVNIYVITQFMAGCQKVRKAICFHIITHGWCTQNSLYKE